MQQALVNAQHSETIIAQVEKAAAQHAQEVLQSELGYFVAPTANSGQGLLNSGQGQIDYAQLAQAMAGIPVKANGNGSHPK